MAKRYCTTCGTGFECAPSDEACTCPGCGAKRQFKYFIPEWTFEARLNQLKAMHSLMCEANDENIYMAWILVMPDEPSEDDFQYIALDEELYNECWDRFRSLIKKDGMKWQRRCKK